MVQSSSQHDKCQVGNIHTYILDLVHFPIIPSLFTHSLSCPLYLSVTITVPILVPSYLERWTEEVGFQARGRLKRQVVRIMRNFSLGERIVGNLFPKVLKCIYRALRLPVQPVVEALEGKWSSRGTIEQRRGTLPGWYKHVGNEGL